jgi:hypothetical protein
MANITIKDAKHFFAAIEKAIEIGKLDNLFDELKWVMNEDDKTEIELRPDFHIGGAGALSFIFSKRRLEAGFEWVPGITGGIIFSESDQSWSTHT